MVPSCVTNMSKSLACSHSFTRWTSTLIHSFKHDLRQTRTFGALSLQQCVCKACKGDIHGTVCLVNYQAFGKWLCGNWIKQWERCIKRKKKQFYLKHLKKFLLIYFKLFSLLPSLSKSNTFLFGDLFSSFPLLSVFFIVEANTANKSVVLSLQLLAKRKKK